MKLDNNGKQAAEKRSIKYPDHLKQVENKKEKLANHRHLQRSTFLVQSWILPLLVYLHGQLLPLIYSQKLTTLHFAGFIYLHVSKSLFIYLPLLQTTFYVPHPRTKLLWRHFKKGVTCHTYASITPHLQFLELLVYPHPRLKPLLLYLSLVKVNLCSTTVCSRVTFSIPPSWANVIFCTPHVSKSYFQYWS